MHGISNESITAILICDREQLFREALRNFLLAASYSQVEVVATAREAMAKLRRQLYGYIFIGMTRPFSLARRLAAIAQKRQPQAKIFLLTNASDLVILPADSSDYIIREHAFESLLNLLNDAR
jgi:DNA-binding NarL/FixJ family response regulator